MGIFFLTASVVFNTIANGFFKKASAISFFNGRKAWLFAAGLLIGLLNTLAYLKALETIRLGTAYPLFAAGSIVLIALMSLFFFGEPISWKQGSGLVVVCIGLFLLWSS